MTKLTITGLGVVLLVSNPVPSTAQLSNSEYIKKHNVAFHSLQRQVADLTQETIRLQQELGSLKLSLEEQRRENLHLRQEIRSTLAKQQQVHNSNVETLRHADKTQEQAIIAEVSRQIQKLASEIQTANTAFLENLNRRSTNPVPLPFSEDYPKQGLSYIVQPGDTLSHIAQKHSAKIRDIQNANKIADPKALRAGQTIFIPQNL